MKHRDHVTVSSVADGRGYLLACAHCGATQTGSLPIAAEKWVAILEYFERGHKHCPPPPTGPAAVPGPQGRTSYANRALFVSVPEDLWADVLALLEEFVAQGEETSTSAATLWRAREWDAEHRRMRDAGDRSTAGQIERGGSGRPYES